MNCAKPSSWQMKNSLLFLIIFLWPNLPVLAGLRKSTSGNNRKPSNSDKYVVTGKDTVMKRWKYEEIQRRRRRLGPALNNSLPINKTSTGQAFNFDKRNTGSTVSRERFFELYEQWESFKDESTTLWTDSDASGRKTLAKFKYVILPIWWSDESPKVPADISNIISVVDENVAYYRRMSWNKHELSYELLEQFVLPVSKSAPTFDSTSMAARQYVDDLGLVQHVDYDGIILMFSSADSGEFIGANYGTVNGDFCWLLFPGWFDVTRHEIGHNYGHPHHLANVYKWRISRGNKEEIYDGWDMMSGGNGFDISDLSAASKWHYNWITDDAVVLLQPKGSSSLCPLCQSSVSGLVLRSFDDVNVTPSSSTKMAVHIPIFGEGNTAYSYWLSYRGFGNDKGAANGLSVHITWFDLDSDSLFGATYDSLNYDAFGDTNEDTSDSFVLPNSCYIIEPALKVLDIDFAAAFQVQPVVCVDDIDIGNSITISVQFLDPNVSPSPVVELSSEIEKNCGLGVTTESFDMSSGNRHLIRYTGTGPHGLVNVAACMESGQTSNVKAFLYDSYPQHLILNDAHPAYGSFMSFYITSSCEEEVSIDYITNGYGEAFILLIPNSDVLAATSVRLTSSCTSSSCGANQFFGGGTCVDCPPGWVSNPGSAFLGDCEPGTSLEPISTAQAWRLSTPSFATQRGWLWDVTSIKFYSTYDCSGESISTSIGSPIDSGNAGAGYEPERAFDCACTWGGRPDMDDIFYIGFEFNEDVNVQCIVLEQNAEDNIALSLRVEAQQAADSAWETVWIQENLQPGSNKIAIQTSMRTTDAPVSPPSTAPIAPTNAPVERTTAPVAPPSGSGLGGLCFSGLSTVEVLGQGMTRMDSLKLGDMVLSADGIYSRVYSFGHFDPFVTTEYFQLSTTDDNPPIEISPDHLIYVIDENAAFKTKKIRSAKEIQIGDFLVSKEGFPLQVQSIRKVVRHGAYSPLTIHGDIVVNGVIASNYVSRPWIPRNYLLLETGQILHWLQHGAVTVNRFVCEHVIMSYPKETYHEATGFSSFVQFWYRVEQWQLDLGTIARFFLGIFILPFVLLAVLIGVVNSLPNLIGSAYWLIFIIYLFGLYLLAWKKSVNKLSPKMKVVSKSKIE